jgi:hypothetical protein
MAWVSIAFASLWITGSSISVEASGYRQGSSACAMICGHADVAELVDALDLGSSIFDVGVRVSPSAL